MSSTHSWRGPLGVLTCRSSSLTLCLIKTASIIVNALYKSYDMGAFSAVSFIYFTPNDAIAFRKLLRIASVS